MSIILLLTCSSITSLCQTTTDSVTCVPNSQLRHAAQLIELGKGYAQMVRVASEKIDSLNKRIEINKQIIDQYKGNDSIHQQIEDNYKKEVANLVSQRDIAVQAAKDINKLLRKQKRKTVIAMLATAAVAVGVHMLIK